MPRWKRSTSGRGTWDVCGVVFKAIKDRLAASRQLALGFWWDSETLKPARIVTVRNAEAPGGVTDVTPAIIKSTIYMQCRY